MKKRIRIQIKNLRREAEIYASAGDYEMSAYYESKADMLERFPDLFEPLCRPGLRKHGPEKKVQTYY